MTAPRRRSLHPLTAPAPRPVSAQEMQARVEADQRLGATLVRLGKLNEEAIEKITEIQRRSNAPFAKAATTLGLLTKEDFVTALGVANGFLREGEGEGRLPQNAVIVRRPASREAEQFRALRARLLTFKDAEKLGLIAIAGVGTSREADHVALNMAASFAQVGKRVLLVDSDLRAARLASRFALPTGPGLRETLAGASDIRKVIRPTVIANLSVLTAGAEPGGSTELLCGDTLRLTFDYLRCAFDVVIVMTTPFGPVADAQFVWAAAGAVFVVARRHQDRLAELKDLNAALRQVGADVIGAALAG